MGGWRRRLGEGEGGWVGGWRRRLSTASLALDARILVRSCTQKLKPRGMEVGGWVPSLGER